MTKKHFVVIARIIKHAREMTDGDNREVSAKNEGIYYVARKMADEFQKLNPRFDRQKFLEACGCESYEEKHREEVCGACGGDNIEGCTYCNTEGRN